MTEFRIVHITLEKCGSQWVRDALTAPEIIRHSGVAYSGIKFNLARRYRLDLPANQLSGPIYNMNQWEWAHWRKPGDRAVVVLRDPRDIVISLQYSLLYSHQADPGTELSRKDLALASSQDQNVTRRMIEAFGAGPRMFFTWTNTADASALVIRYEDLIADQIGGFRGIYDWLGWRIPEDILALVVRRLSFESRSGRAPGTLDPYSHYRKGVAGDWRNYFTREHGRYWERAYPGLLRSIGYESADDWWEELPATTTPQANQALSAELRFTAALSKRNELLELQLEEKEGIIRGLDAECDSRLAAIRALETALVQRTNEAHERLAVLHALDAERGQLLAVCEERLRVINELTAALSSHKTQAEE